MPMKGSGRPSLREIDRWDGGVGWIAYPREGLQRASHALAVDGEVWVVDPVDAPGVDDLLAEFGDVAGVVVCLDRHGRDAGTIARRHGVPVYLPEWMGRAGSSVSAPVERFGRELADTGYRAIELRNSAVPPWREVALYREADGTLVVPEAVGTTGFFLADGERLGVHPVLRPFPPRESLGDLSPERVLVGHGEGVLERAEEALREALRGARRRAPGAYLNAFRAVISR